MVLPSFDSLKKETAEMSIITFIVKEYLDEGIAVHTLHF